jgi:hypothetical protein
LGRRPAALDHANVFRHWELPAVFTELRHSLEGQLGPTAGARQFIRVLQLLAEHPLGEVQRAIEMSRTPQGFAVEVIVRRAGGAARELPQAAVPDELSAVQVPPPNLRQFDQLLSQEVSDD